MKNIVQVAIVAFACSAGAAWSQQEEIKAQEEAGVTVAQAGSGAGERAAISREEAKPGKTSMHDLMDLGANGVFPSRGGPLDD